MHIFKSLLILLVFVFLFARSLFSSSMPVTHDLDIHAPRVVNYYLAFKQGQIPPQWAPNLNYNFGYPVFLFTYPYPYIVSSFLYALGFSVETSLNLFLITSIFLGAFGVYTLSFLKSKKTYLSLLPAFLYLSAPYILLNIFVRGALGEIAFLSLLPWVFVIAELINNKKTKLINLLVNLLAIPILVIFILSHQVMAALGLIIIFLKYFNKKLLLFISLALLISAFSLLPMLLEKQFVQAGSGSEYALKHDLSDHVSLKELIFSKWEYSGLVDSNEDGRFAKTIGVVQVLILFIAIYALFKNKNTKSSKELIFWVSIFSLLVFLNLPVSMPVWRVFKFLEYLQFPWRLLGFVVFSSSMILIELLKSKILSNLVIKIISLLIIFSLLWAVIFHAKPVAQTRKDAQDWLFYPGTGDSYSELMPIWFDSNKNLGLDKRLTLRQDGELVDSGFVDTSWTGSKMSYSVESQSSAEILQKTAYFPGWEARVNSNKVNINYQDEQYPGRIIIPIEKGQSRVELKFTNNTWARRVGTEMAALGLALWVGVTFYSAMKWTMTKLAKN